MVSRPGTRKKPTSFGRTRTRGCSTSWPTSIPKRCFKMRARHRLACGGMSALTCPTALSIMSHCALMSMPATPALRRPARIGAGFVGNPLDVYHIQQRLRYLGFPSYDGMEWTDNSVIAHYIGGNLTGTERGNKTLNTSGSADELLHCRWHRRARYDLGHQALPGRN